MRLNLTAERLVFERRDKNYVSRFTGIESALVLAPKARVVGSDGADTLNVSGCDVEVDGGAGDDTLISDLEYDADTGEDFEAPCLEPDIQTYNGGDGDDTLIGNRFDNTLSGGNGTDTAIGNEGTDTCTAEIIESCES